MTAANMLTYSSELMTNYLHAGIMDAEDAFEALQDANGNALLFSIGTDGVLYATQETPVGSNTTGASGTPAGWVRLDLSTAQLSHDYPQAAATCKTMAVNQNNADGTIGLAMVATQNGTDTLYLCLGNSASDTSWLASPAWLACPYNDPAGPAAPSPLIILNVFIDEASDGQYVVADIASSADELVHRYYITQGTAVLWNQHTLATDFQRTSPYSSCLGRAARNSVDGIYTFGTVGASPQFLYCPLWNTNGAGPPLPTLLTLPAGGGVFDQPQAMAAFRNGSTDNSTDLFVTATNAAGTGVLYYIPASLSGQSSAGIQVLTHPAFINVAKLQADLTGGIVTVWGLNSANQIICTSCAYAEITTTSAWSVPVPILSGVAMASPYVNQVNGGNTIFASDGESNLYVLTKSPQTGMWQTAQITLPAPDSTSQPVVLNSYTTRLRLTDANNLPVGNTQLLLSAVTRVSFYVNNLYTVLDPTPITVTTDPFGVITIIEGVTGLHGTQLNVSEPGGDAVAINPMETPFNKAAALNTAAALQEATITNGDGSTSPLVPAGTSQTDLITAAQANQGLATAYAQLATSPAGLTARPAVVRPTAFGDTGGMAIDFGDLYNWLKSGVEASISIVEDASSGLYNFLAEIGGQLYQAVLDGVEKVVGAIEWVYNQIKTLLADLISYLQFLFEWQDILAAHNVLKNMLTQYVQYAINNVSTLNTTIAATFTQLETEVNQWAGITDYDQTSNQVTAASQPPQAVHGAPANLGGHHFQANVGSVTTSYAPGSAGSILDDLTTLITNEEDAVENLVTEIKTQIIDQFETLSITQVVQKLAAIVVDFLLKTAQNILTTMVDALAQLTQGVLDLLTTPLNIPVLSWLYTDISGNTLTFLDLFCLIGAIPVNIVYKLLESEAPFPSGATLTNELTAASSFEQIQTLLTSSVTESQPSQQDQALTLAPVSGSSLGKANFAFSIFAVVGAIAMSILAPIRAEEPAGTDKKLAALNGVANLLYVSPGLSPMLQHDTRWFAATNDAFTGASVLKGLSLDIYATGTLVSSGVESVLNLAWNVPVIANIIYTSNNPNAPDADQFVVPDSLGNFAFNVGGMLAPFSSTPEVINTQVSLMGIYALMSIIVGTVQL